MLLTIHNPVQMESHTVYTCSFSSGSELQLRSLRPLDPEITGRNYLGAVDSEDLDLDAYRPLQEEVILLLQTLARTTPKSRIYLSAPTGSGKSVIARGYLRGFDPVETPGLILTADHALQEQYADLGIASITGKPNWPCLIDPTKPASKADCARGAFKPQSCEFYHACPYFTQREQGWASDCAVTNYHYLLQGSGKLPHRYIVADEAHFVEPILRDMQTITLDLRPPKDIAMAVTMRPQVEELLAALQSELTRHPQETELDRVAYNLLNEKLTKVKRVVGLMNRYQRLARVMPDPKSRYRSVFFSPLGGMSYLSHSLPLLAMSATLCDPFLLEGVDAAKSDAHKEMDIFSIEVPSTFPARNRPIYPLNTVKVGRGMTELDYRSLVWTIDRLLEQHGNTKGVIHTVSYEMARQIKELSDYPMLMVDHGSGGRDDAIEQFKAAPLGRVLLSPAAATGVDLPYDLCRWQAIAKLPFPYMGDPMVKVRMEEFPQLSSLDTAQTIVQMAGRGMRAADDTCETYILDANWRWFWGRNWQLFPQWFREAVRKQEVA